MVIWILLGSTAFLILCTLVISYICFRMAFYVPKRKGPPTDALEFPQGSIYMQYRDKISQWILETRKLSQEVMTVTSFDGLTLYGNYYEYAPGAPIELMFHGYRSTAERDLSGGVQRCFKLGRSALVVDQRCCGRSEGNVITFGINEHRDCLTWLAHMRQRFGDDVKVILTGLSMGAGTVMIAAGAPDLPDNVIGVLADCGYSSPKDIIQKVIRDMKLPPTLSYPFVKLGARIFGHFDLEETSPVEALKNSKVPVLLIHGEDDNFVPCDMSRKCYESCTAKKRLVTVPGAGHGLVYLVDNERYFQSVVEFFSENGVETKLVREQK